MLSGNSCSPSVWAKIWVPIFFFIHNTKSFVLINKTARNYSALDGEGNKTKLVSQSIQFFFKAVWFLINEIKFIELVILIFSREPLQKTLLAMGRAVLLYSDDKARHE